VNGNICIERTIRWSRGSGSDGTIDTLLGLAADRVSAGVRQMCCAIAIEEHGFARAAEQLSSMAQIKISPERLRIVTQTEGRNVLRVQAAGLLGPSFNAADCKVAPQGPSRVYIGVDGVKVPMVTAAEKAKRRKNRRWAKKSRSARRMHPGADNAYKEFKIGTIYDEANEHRQVVATSGNHEAMGRLMRREAARMKLSQADEKLAVADGADWIAKQLNVNLPMLDKIILDFYHLSEHVWVAANSCCGQDSEPARQMGVELLHIAKHDGVAALLAAIASLRKKHCHGRRREALDQLLGYIGRRAATCDYPEYTAKGWQIGSGPTEAMCKVLTYRLKGPGMRWDKFGAEAMMALIALRESNTWKTYWQAQKHAA